jgi:hypothetical protein
MSKRTDIEGEIESAITEGSFNDAVEKELINAQPTATNPQGRDHLEDAQTDVTITGTLDDHDFRADVTVRYEGTFNGMSCELEVVEEIEEVIPRNVDVTNYDTNDDDDDDDDQE